MEGMASPRQVSPGALTNAFRTLLGRRSSRRVYAVPTRLWLFRQGGGGGGGGGTPIPPPPVHGRTTRFIIRCNPNDARLVQVADAVLKTCERDLGTFETIFGTLAPETFDVSIIHTPASNYGASHPDCFASNIIADSRFTPVVDPDFTRI